MMVIIVVITVMVINDLTKIMGNGGGVAREA